MAKLQVARVSTMGYTAPDTSNAPTLTYSMNRLAGTLSGGVPTMEAQGAGNKWAGTFGLHLVGALNIKAGNPRTAWRDLQGVLNQLAGTSGLGIDAAASKIGV